MEKHVKIDMIGKRSGRLLVIAPAPAQAGRARWVCQCDCGNKCTATGKSLRKQQKQSCGCIKRDQLKTLLKDLHKHNELPYGIAASNHLYSVYKIGAKKRNLVFELTIDDFRRITSDVCYFCGEKPKGCHWGVTCSTPYIFNGIDRLDNSIGYVLSNCVTACKTCNWMKRVMTEEQFLNKCISIVNNMNCKKAAEMSASSSN